MSAPSNCCQSACAAVEVIEVPGVEGDAGLPGDDGQSAFTLTTSNFVVPALAAAVTVTVVSNAWMAVGQTIFIPGAGTFQVASKTGTTTVSLTYLDYVSNTETGETINTGTSVVASGVQGPASTGTLPNAITDNSTGTASDTIVAQVGIYNLVIPLTSLATGLSTSAIDLLTTLTIGHRFKILSFDFVTTIVGAGAGASQVFNLEIGTTNLTGGTLTVTLASTDTIGKITAGTAITGANVGAIGDTISLEMAAGGTVFTSGSGYFVIRIQDMSLADAIASLADHVNDLITAVTN